MSDHPSQPSDPRATPRDEQSADDVPPARPDHPPADEKSVTERVEDEAATYGDFA